MALSQRPVADSAFGNGALYNPVTDSWMQLGSGGGARQRHNAVWDGNEMLIFGGYYDALSIDTPFNDTRAYYPGRVLFLYQRP